MAKEKSKREVYTRGAAPKISLVLTGIETFALLIAGIFLLFAGRTLNSGATDMLSSSSDSTMDAVVELFSANIGEMLSQLFLILGGVILIFGIWCFIFWVICAKSKRRRVRDVICTIFGRLPVVAILVVAAAAGFFGWLFAILLVWVVLAILLSAVGWKESRG